LRLVNKSGERIIPISEFYLGRNHTILQKDELLVEILMNKSGLDNYYYKKVGTRKALAMSRVSFAAILKVEDGKINQCITSLRCSGRCYIQAKKN